MISTLYICCIISCICSVLARTVIDIKGKDVGDVSFEQIPLKHSSTGRPVYYSRKADLYLYHVIMAPTEGVARWIISNELFANNHALAFMDSWAVTPCVIGAVTDNPSKNWQSPVDGLWTSDESFSLSCYDDSDDLIYLEMNHDVYLSGFFVRMAVTDHDTSPVYMKLQRGSDDRHFYLYRYETRWIIGNTIGKDDAIAFVVDEDSKFASEIRVNDWWFMSEEAEAKDPENPFAREFVDIIYRNEEDLTIFEAMQRARTLRDYPEDQFDRQGVKYLRNGVGFPVVGLGTGGIPSEKTSKVVTSALQKGYRLLDLAREYNNEDVIHEVFKNTQADRLTPAYYEVFIQTKVWPTELGFAPTTQAILQSRQDLQMSGINNYMLHWPACYGHIKWMHCESTIDPLGTWVQSYRALERAYCEGDIVSIGVSNFDANLLREVEQIANILPHVVQNFATVGQTDKEVRNWCSKNEAIYQPYAIVRNLAFLDDDTKEVLYSIARPHKVAIQSVVYRYFIQLGCAIIPRSTDDEHLMDNLNVLKWTLSVEEMRKLDKLVVNLEDEEENEEDEDNEENEL